MLDRGFYNGDFASVVDMVHLGSDWLGHISGVSGGFSMDFSVALEQVPEYPVGRSRPYLTLLMF